MPPVPTVINYPVVEPKSYFETSRKSLEERLAEIKVSNEEKAKIAAGGALKLIKDSVFGILPAGEVIKGLIDYNDHIEKEVAEAKKSVLLEYYFDQQDRSADALSKLVSLATNPSGSVLFNKAMRILNDNPPDLELINHLSAAISRMVDSNFEALFDQHKFALAQIEQLSAQALSILADQKNWKPISLGSMVQTQGTKVTSDFVEGFVRSYTHSKNITNEAVLVRVQHSVIQLINARLMEANRISGNQGQCEPTHIGRELLPYLAQQA